MLALKYLLITVGTALLMGAAAILIYDIYISLRRREPLNEADRLPETDSPPQAVRWNEARRLCLLAVLPLLTGLSITVIPSGYAGVRVSQIAGAQLGVSRRGTDRSVHTRPDEWWKSRGLFAARTL